MKFPYYILLIALSLLACENSNDNHPNSDLIGVWQLKAVYLDPGDGSVDFRDVDSDRVFVFDENNMVSTNGPMCQMTSEIGEEEVSSYSVINDTIKIEACPQLNFALSGNTLIIHYPCIESCQAKYKKQ